MMPSALWIVAVQARSRSTVQGVGRSALQRDILVHEDVRKGKTYLRHTPSRWDALLFQNQIPLLRGLTSAARFRQSESEEGTRRPAENVPDLASGWETGELKEREEERDSAVPRTI